MTQREMIYAFCRMGISDQHFWLGAIEKAEHVNGMTYNGNSWIVYYRENGQLQHVHEFATQNEACDELYTRVVQSVEKEKQNDKSERRSDV